MQKQGFIYFFFNNLSAFSQNPPTGLEYIRQMLPTLLQLLGMSDKQIKADACWAMSYITDGPNERIQLIIDVSGRLRCRFK